MMKKIILVIIFCFPLWITNTFAQTKQESIKELFSLLKMDEMANKSFESIFSSTINQMKSQSPTKNATNNLPSDDKIQSVMQSMKIIMKKMIDEDMVGIYDKYFTQQEINDFITFYKSPSGQKYIQVMPDAMNDVMTLMTQKYMPEMQKIFKEQEQEMKNDEEE